MKSLDYYYVPLTLDNYIFPAASGVQQNAAALFYCALRHFTWLYIISRRRGGLAFRLWVNCSFKGRGSQCILIISIWTRSQSAALKCKEEMMNSSSQALIPLILQAESLCCMMMNVNVVSNRLLWLIKHQMHQKGMKYEFYRVKTRRDFQQCGHLRTLGKVLFIEDT